MKKYIIEIDEKQFEFETMNKQELFNQYTNLGVEPETAMDLVKLGIHVYDLQIIDNIFMIDMLTKEEILNLLDLRGSHDFTDLRSLLLTLVEEESEYLVERVMTFWEVILQADNNTIHPHSDILTFEWTSDVEHTYFSYYDVDMNLIRVLLGDVFKLVENLIVDPSFNCIPMEENKI